MFVCFYYYRGHFFNIIWQWLSLLFLIFKLTYSQEIFTAKITLSNPGTQYIPANTAGQLISTIQADSVKNCATLCTNNVLCHIFDYEVSVSKQCRLFEGDTTTMGKIVASSSPKSYVGTIRLSSDLFAERGRSCTSFCYHSRYLQCSSNFTCDCMPHTYWDSSVSMCVPQSPILGAPCKKNMSMCRQDLNYTCLQFNQCGPLSVLSGTTVMDSTTTVVGSSTAGLQYPFGLTVFGTDRDIVIIVDEGHNRVIGMWNAGTINQNISVVATEWAPGQALCYPYDVYVDTRNGTNLYVSDYCSAQVVFYTNMQSINPLPLVVAGKGRTSGAAPNYLNAPFGVQVDSRNNVYVASMSDNSVIFWPRNATSGILLVGVGTASSSSMGLNGPGGIALDERNSVLYVADANNHRIQRYSLNGTWPCNGTTVAGGNGQGSASNQLNKPRDIWISNKTGTMYIVDNSNNRVQRWEKGATEGVTIAGDPNGSSGTDATKLKNPLSVALNANETLMYVTDSTNHRVQRFQII